MRERIITDAGVIMPRFTWFERRVLKFVFGKAGKAVARAIFKRQHEEQAIPDLEAGLDDLQTLIQIAEDFEKGRVEGRLIDSNEELNTENIHPNPVKLIRLYRKVRNSGEF